MYTYLKNYFLNIFFTDIYLYIYTEKKELG